MNFCGFEIKSYHQNILCIIPPKDKMMKKSERMTTFKAKFLLILPEEDWKIGFFPKEIRRTCHSIKKFNIIWYACPCKSHVTSQILLSSRIYTKGLNELSKLNLISRIFFIPLNTSLPSCQLAESALTSYFESMCGIL